MNLTGIRILALLTLIASCGSAREFVLSDTATNVGAREWSISSQDLGLKLARPFSIRQRLLHGGRQEGVSMIEVDNGQLQFSVIPTRGMNVYRVKSGVVELGWNSPVREIVNPAYINIDTRGGVGWLEGFNEFLVRCGVEWAGHPGLDDGQLLSLHGRIASTPASTVIVTVDDVSPYRIHVRGRVVEQAFKFSDFELWTDLSTEPNSSEVQVHDTITNRSDYEHEFQIIYHGNFSTPLLEAGSEFDAPVARVTPFDDFAATDLATWKTYRGPTANFGEQVYMVWPLADPSGQTIAMLRNRPATLGVALRFNTAELPYFSLWKNTDTLNQGYVTGLEPGTGFPFSRAIERRFHRVPKLGPHESRSFSITYAILSSPQAVSEVARSIERIRGGRSTTVDEHPPQLLPTEGKR